MNIDGMTDEQKRIRIAEACGYIWFQPPDGSKAYLQFPSDRSRDLRDIPDYLSDLNAMHEVEKVLTEEQAQKYDMLLAGPHSSIARLIHNARSASARQRADAFLSVI